MASLLLMCSLMLFVIAAADATPPRPKIPETFSSWVVFTEITARNSISFNEYNGYISRSEKHQRELFNSTDPEFGGIFSLLDLYDEEMEYEIDGDPVYGSECYSDTPYNTSFPLVWDFLTDLEYFGHHNTLNGEMWVAQYTADLYTILVVSPLDPNIPIMVSSYDTFTGMKYTIRYIGFSAKEPVATDFTIPYACQNELSHRKKGTKKLNQKFHLPKRLPLKPKGEGKKLFNPLAFL